MTNHGVVKKKLLVVRADRLGDLVLSTPVFQNIVNQSQEYDLDVLVNQYALPVVSSDPNIKKAISYHPMSTHRGIRGVWRLAKEIRQGRYEAALVLQTQFRLLLALWLARVPRRIGPFSKWYSYLFLNEGRRQKRSRVEMHEADYNLQLLNHLDISPKYRTYAPKVYVSAEGREFIKQWCVEKDISDFIIIHPGMGGSALNWPEAYYSDLAQMLAMHGYVVVITGSAKEQELVNRVHKLSLVQNADSDWNKRVLTYIGEDGHKGLDQFIALLEKARVVVAPSTGPLHLATAVGTRTVSFFPPIRVQSAMRWGPYSLDEKVHEHEVMVPDALCGQDFRCAGSRCHFYFCMDRIGVEEAYQKVTQLYGSKT